MGPTSPKNKLNYQEQIEHLEKKGIQFNHFTKDAAANYLEKNNNFFRLLSYRKNFDKRINDGTYINLDFGQLVDLAVIDTRIRMIIVEMALNIEHFAKISLLWNVTNDINEDGYSIISDYVSSLDLQGRLHLQSEIQRNQNSIYVQDIYAKYKNNMPIWAFVEILSFGRFIHFYRYCADRFNDKDMKDNRFLFLSVKKVRNAAAHNNCLINDLSIKTHKYKVNYGLKTELSKIGIKLNQRKKKLACERIAQIITCLYVHRRIVSSPGSQAHIAYKLNDLSSRFFRDFDYKSSPIIQTNFALLAKIIDKWFPIA